VERVGRRIDHARKQLDAFQLSEGRVRQHGLDRGSQTLVIDRTGEAAVRFAATTAASLIYPFAPHLASEVWERLSGGDLWEEPWPQADAELLVADVVTPIVQVHGKLRDRIEAPADASQEDLLALAKASEKVRAHVEGHEIVKEIVVPGKLVNLVVRAGNQ
jgi:leucyl-tRNA synthetase